MSAPFSDHLSAWAASRITSLFTSPTTTAFWDSLDSSVSPKAIVTLNGVGLTREQYGDQLTQLLKLAGDQRERRVEIDSLDVLSTSTLFSERDQSHTSSDNGHVGLFVSVTVTPNISSTSPVPIHHSFVSTFIIEVRSDTSLQRRNDSIGNIDTRRIFSINHVFGVAQARKLSAPT